MLTGTYLKTLFFFFLTIINLVFGIMVGLVAVLSSIIDVSVVYGPFVVIFEVNSFPRLSLNLLIDLSINGFCYFRF